MRHPWTLLALLLAWSVSGPALAQHAERLKEIDALYATIPPVKYAPPAERWAHIPRTMQSLKEGGALRIVMLGDSIVNDTSTSSWELLLARRYPRCKIDKVTSVEGGKGCWWYREDNRVKPYVLDHKPDLLMIGGISHREDVESIREVIRQVRKQSAPEILVMTGAVYLSDPRSNKDWTYEVDPRGAGYRSRLLRMAREEKVELLDLTGPWGEYIAASPKEAAWFMRDTYHANDRGKQVLARILEKYFAPK